ncbi:MAG: ABC transporter ATP-binding protein [Deltaproteobacteria bacterium]|nr:ABC transporter ATP-binding protein [Deltaproteobacteria bacterium]
MEPILEVKNLTMAFGGLLAIDALNLTVHENEIVALIGPNGAGKTTLFNCITGIHKPTGGDVFINTPAKKHRRINGLKPHKITESGMARTFQNIRLFPNMTVLENVMIGRHCRSNAGVLGAVLKDKKTRKEEKDIIEYCHNLLEKIGLNDYINEVAKNLPYGVQRRLEIVRAMATNPFLLLLDEPAAGMNTQETNELDDLIRKIRDDENIAILLIEHDMKLVMSLAEKIAVMDYGKKIAEGTPEEIKSNPVVIKAYLGEEDDT